MYMYSLEKSCQVCSIKEMISLHVKGEKKKSVGYKKNSQEPNSLQNPIMFPKGQDRFLNELKFIIT